MRQFFNGQANKFLVALLGWVSASLPIYYGTAKWEPVAIAGVSVLMTWLVPNVKSDQEPPKSGT